MGKVRQYPHRGGSRRQRRTDTHLFFYNVSGKKELERIAREEMEKYKYSGYEGKITTFIQPYAIPGMVAVLEDKRYNERKGNYYIIGTKVSFGMGGARRMVELGIKV